MLLHSAFLLLCSLSSFASGRHHPTVYLIRHGEKPENPDNHGLTLDGTKRAQCLREVFGAHSDYHIGHIMAPTMKWNGAHGRAYMTVLPLAQDLGLTIDDDCSRSDAECVADTIRSYDGSGNILIAWRHKNIPDIQKVLGSEHPLKYPVHRFDVIWTIPFPYDDVVDIKSEDCPELDKDSLPGLVAQY